jgi:hypothetical protein
MASLLPSRAPEDTLSRATFMASFLLAFKALEANQKVTASHVLSSRFCLSLKSAACNPSVVDCTVRALRGNGMAWEG